MTTVTIKNRDGISELNESMRENITRAGAVKDVVFEVMGPHGQPTDVECSSFVLRLASQFFGSMLTGPLPGMRTESGKLKLPDCTSAELEALESFILRDEVELPFNVLAGETVECGGPLAELASPLGSDKLEWLRRGSVRRQGANITPFVEFGHEELPPQPRRPPPQSTTSGLAEMD